MCIYIYIYIINIYIYIYIYIMHIMRDGPRRGVSPTAPSPPRE